MAPSIIIKSREGASNLLNQDKGNLIRKMISIGDPGEQKPTGHQQVDDVLRLEFHDVKRADYDKFDPPDPKHVREIIRFANRLKDENYQGILLVHCHAGVSRSSAAAYICNCVWMGDGKEQEALDKVYQINHKAKPNPLLVKHADQILRREGIMNKTLSDNPKADSVSPGTLLNLVEAASQVEPNLYPEAGKDAPPEVQQAIEKFRGLPAKKRAEQPLLYHILGSGTPLYKMSKEDSEYTDAAKGKQTCGNCQFLYLSVARDKHICSQIEGYVEPEGWCRLWVPGKEDDD